METSQRPNAAGGPPWFPWGRSWEAELWHGGGSRCGLCRAGWGGGRGGLRLAAGPCLRRGRPGGACGGASSPRPTSPRPHTGRGRLPLCSPPAGPAPGQHRLGWAWASLTAPVSAERGPLPVSTGQTQWSRLVQQRTRPRRDLRGLVTCRSCQSPPSPSHGLPERAPDLSKRCPESPECRTTL